MPQRRSSLQSKTVTLRTVDDGLSFVCSPAMTRRLTAPTCLPIPSKWSRLPPTIPAPMYESEFPYMGAPEVGSIIERASVPEYLLPARSVANDRYITMQFFGKAAN